MGLTLNQLQDNNEILQKKLIYSVAIGNNPKIPVEGHNRLNPNEVQRWISAHPRELQTSVAELSSRVEHISFPTFLSHFQEGVDLLNDWFQKERIDDYMIMVEPGKSNQWMAEIAFPQLQKKPNEVYSLGKKGSHYEEYLQKELATDIPYFPSTIVYFDDGIYSGKQMSNFIKGVLEATKKVNQELAAKGKDLIQIPQVIVIAPYATENGVQLIYKTNGDFESPIFFSPHERIKTVAEVISSTALHILNNSIWKEDPRDLINGEFLHEFRRGGHTRGNIWFDHKIPNWLSFVQPLEFGIVSGLDGQPINGSLIEDLQGEPVFNSTSPYAPIPRTIPPYKLEF